MRMRPRRDGSFGPSRKRTDVSTHEACLIQRTLGEVKERLQSYASILALHISHGRSQLPRHSRIFGYFAPKLVVLVKSRIVSGTISRRPSAAERAGIAAP